MVLLRRGHHLLVVLGVVLALLLTVVGHHHVRRRWHATRLLHHVARTIIRGIIKISAISAARSAAIVELALILGASGWAWLPGNIQHSDRGCIRLTPQVILLLL